MNGDLHEEGLNTAHQRATFRFSHFPVPVLSCTVSTERRVKNPTLAFCPLAGTCVLTILTKLISSSVLSQVHCALVVSARAAGELRVQVCQHMNPSAAFRLFPTSWIPPISDAEHYYRGGLLIAVFVLPQKQVSP